MVVNYKVAAVTAGLAGALTLTGFAAPALAETADAIPQAEQTDGKTNPTEDGSVYKTADGLLVGENAEGQSVVVDSQGLLFVKDESGVTWHGFYSDDASLDDESTPALYLSDSALAKFNEEATKITSQKDIVMPASILGTAMTKIQFEFVDGVEYTAMKGCTSLDLSAISLEDMFSNADFDDAFFKPFTSLDSVKLPKSMPDIWNPLFDTDSAPRELTLSFDTLPSLCSGAFMIQKGGSVHVPAGSEELYFNWLLGRSVDTGDALHYDPPFLIANGDSSYAPATKQEIFGVATDSNPVIVDNETGLAFMKNSEGTLDCIGFNSLEAVDDGTMNVVIPAQVNGVDVTSIATLAFYGSPYENGAVSVKSLTIPETVKSLQENAFQFMSCAGELVVPATVTDIPSFAFSHFSAPKLTVLGSVDIPRSIVSGAFIPSLSFPNATGIETDAFTNSSGLASLEINPSMNPSSIADKIISSYHVGKLTYVSGPESLVSKFEETVKQNVQSTNQDKTVYTVTIHGVDGSVSTQAVVNGQKVANVPDEPSMPGFTFKGWVAKDDKAFDPAKDPVAEDLVLSASFELDAPKVTLTASNEKPTEGDVVTLTAKAEHEAEGTTFTYQWYCDGVKVEGATESTLNATGSGDYEVKVVATNGGRTATARASIELAYAPKPEEPKPLTHKVTVVFGNGSNDMVLTVNDGDKITGIEAPEREGYEFAGWFLTVDEDGKLSDEYDFSKPVTGDFTLYAGWVKKGSQGEKPEGGSEQKPEEKPADKPTEGALPKTGDASLLSAAAASLSGLAALAGAYLTRKRR